MTDRPILRWHGGKHHIRHWVLSHFPPHDTYVEPYAGAASVLMAKPPARVEVINDKYNRLVNLFRVLRCPEKAEILARMLRLTPYAEAEYHLCRMIHPDPIEDARRLIVLGHQGHGSTAASGGKESGWRRGFRPLKRPASAEWQWLWREVEPWADRLRGVLIEQREATEVITERDTPQTLFYVDPPYVRSSRAMESCRAGYAHEMTDDDHVQLADVLHQVSGMVVLSGYRCELYEALYRGWHRHDTEAWADKGAKRVESVWLNPACLAGLRQLDLLGVGHG